jgi:phage terminase large subunit
LSGGEIFYKGLARNITSLKSVAGVKRLWIEEGESVSHNSLRILTPSIRSAPKAKQKPQEPEQLEDGTIIAASDIPEIWITMNRRYRTDAIAEKYLSRAEEELARTGRYEDEMMMVVQLNWRDNPWFPPELELERQDDYERLSRAEYDHIWEGSYRDNIENALIKAEWFDACVDAHIKLGFKPTGAVVVTHDPSESGDAKAVLVRHGSVITDGEEYQIGDANAGCDYATDYAAKHGADYFSWDCDGLGITLNRQVTQNLAGKKIEIVQFRGSNSVDNPTQPYDSVKKTTADKVKTQEDTYYNRRAQFYGRLADRIYRTYLAVEHGERVFDPDDLISFSSQMKHLSVLRTQLTRLPLKPNGSGKIQLMSKVEMKAQTPPIESPNLGDCAMMSMMIPAPKKAGYVPIRQKTVFRR